MGLAMAIVWMALPFESIINFFGSLAAPIIALIEFWK